MPTHNRRGHTKIVKKRGMRASIRVKPTKVRRKK